MKNPKFHEINYDKPHKSSSYHEEKINKHKKDKPEWFYELKNIRNSYKFTFSASKNKEFIAKVILLEQLKYLGPIRDNFTEIHEVDEQITFPYLNYEQLRSYLTFKTKTKDGTKAPTNQVYLLNFTYSILNNFESISFNISIKYLIYLLRNYSHINVNYQRNLVEWIKLYFVLNNNNTEFTKFIIDNNLHDIYEMPQIFTSPFDFYVNLQDYKIKSSILFKKEENLYIKAFNTFWNVLSDKFKNNNINLNTALVQPIKTKLYPHFYNFPHFINLPRNLFYKVNEFEIFEAVGNDLFQTNFGVTKKGRLFLSYIFKHLDKLLRNHLNLKNITTDILTIDEYTNAILKKLEIDLEDFMQNFVTNYFRQSSSISIEINIDKLDDIRRESDEIKEALLVEDKDLIFQDEKSISIVQPNSKTKENQTFITSLNNEEFKLLQLVYNNTDPSNYKSEFSVMIEVIYASINEKFNEFYFDSLFNEENQIYEDYTDLLKEIFS